MKAYLTRHYRVFGSIGALIALTVAVIYLVVVPEEAAGAAWAQGIILTYGHSVCWFLLCGASIVWAVNGKNRWSAPLSYAGLAVYVVFMVTLLGATITP